MSTPLRRVSIQGYRAARALELFPGSVCALVGEGSSGKSTVLTAIWTLLEAAAPPPTIAGRRARAEGGRIHLEADIAQGTVRRTIFLDARPPDTLNLNRAGAPPVLFLPANLRKRTLAAPATGSGAAEVAGAPAPPSVDHHWAAADGGLALIAGMERLLASNLRHLSSCSSKSRSLLPQPARAAAHLYSVLRALAQQGNQILYSTHALRLPQRRQARGASRSSAIQRRPAARRFTSPSRSPRRKGFCALSEFDSERAEFSFLARVRGPRRGHGRRSSCSRCSSTRARRRRRQGRDPRARVRRQGQHAALRADLQRAATCLGDVVVRDIAMRRRAASDRSSRSASSIRPDPRGRGGAGATASSC